MDADELFRKLRDEGAEDLTLVVHGPDHSFRRVTLAEVWVADEEIHNRHDERYIGEADTDVEPKKGYRRKPVVVLS